MGTLEWIMGAAFAGACVFMLLATLWPIMAEPGKDGWNDVD